MSCCRFPLTGGKRDEVWLPGRGRMRRFRVLLFQLICIGILIFAAHAASADSNCVGTTSSCSFTLNNTGVSGGPFVTATVTLNTVGNATIQFNAAPGDGIVAVSSLSL